MKSSFPKCNKHHSKRWNSYDNVKFIDYVLKKSFSHINVCTYMYIYLKSSFPKHHIWTCHWHCNLDFWIGT